jgi:hypothetical protein
MTDLSLDDPLKKTEIEKNVAEAKKVFFKNWHMDLIRLVVLDQRQPNEGNTHENND